jgi:hypothetical protein
MEKNNSPRTTDPKVYYAYTLLQKQKRGQKQKVGHVGDHAV